MQSIITRCLGLLMIMALAACGSGSGALPTSASTTSNTNPTADTSSAQSASAATGLEYIHYTVKMTGESAANVEGTTQSIFMEGSGRLLSFSGPDMSFQAIVQTPETVQTGEHPLSASGDYRAQISTSYEASGTYDSNVSGKLNITSVEPLQGTFEYSAATTTGETMTATGSFDEVVYSYTTKATGAVETSIPSASSGRAMITVLGDDDILSFDTSDPSTLIPDRSVFSISFYMPTDIAAGEYELAAYLEEAEGQIPVIINDNDEGTVAFEDNLKGTLTLTEVGAQYSGTYNGTAESSDGKTLTVEGSFTDLPVIEAINLP
jgi:hypothetical protein